ncbi:MAG: glycerophosphodiester phosphodiesterase family protein [Mycobacterium sp.]|nr:glycerophosphodiester phosphodiesterase family protein [Mycobacterium sp.]
MTARLGAVAFALMAVAALLAPGALSQPRVFDLQAHRGGRGETTEESLRGFAKSLELGVTTLELDVVITEDGQPLVWHDPTIQPEKCSDTAPASRGDPQYPYVGKPVHDLTLAQIRTLHCDRRLEEFPRAEAVRHNQIAILPEVFALADSYGASGPGGIRYNIETKVDADKPWRSADPAQFVDVILAAVGAAGQTDNVGIQSLDWRILPMVRRAEPSIPLAALWDRKTWVSGSPWLGQVDPGQVPDPVVAAITVGADIVSPDYSLVDKAFVDHAHALGRKVIPWTVDDAAVMRQQISDGVDGLITDYPRLLRSVLASLGVPLPRRYH